MLLTPTNVLVQAASEAVAADASSLADAMGLKVHLCTDNIDPDGVTDFTALTEVTFMGGTAKTATMGAAQEGRDPATGRRLITIPEPVGGWRWECTMDIDPGETARLVVVTDNASAVTYSAAKIEPPVTVTKTGDVVIVGSLDLLMQLNPWAP